jgi:hypothetical protein
MMRERKQDIVLSTPLLKRLGIAPHLKVFEMERLGASVANPADPIGFNSWDRLSSGSYGTVYSRTATTMHDLESHLGKDVTERAFKQYYARWKFRHPSVADLRDVLVEVSGKPELVNAYFAQQVYGTGKVDDRISKVESSEQLPQPGLSYINGKWVELTTDQVEKKIKDTREAWKKANPKAKEGTGPYSFLTTVIIRRQGAPVPQTLVVNFADGSKETVQWNEDRAWARFTWVKPVKAVSAQLDPERKNLLDRNKLDDSRTVEADTSASRRWSGHIASFFQSLFALLVTV